MLILTTGGTGKLGSKFLDYLRKKKFSFENIDSTKSLKLFEYDNFLPRSFFKNKKLYTEDIIFIHFATVYRGKKKEIKFCNYDFPKKIINFKNLNIIKIINIDSFFSDVKVNEKFFYLKDYIFYKKKI